MGANFTFNTYSNVSFNPRFASYRPRFETPQHASSPVHESLLGLPSVDHTSARKRNGRYSYVRCDSCSHIFPSYGSRCPVCDRKRPTSRRSIKWTAICAVMLSALAIGGTCLMVVDFFNDRTAAPLRVTSNSTVSKRTKVQGVEPGEVVRPAALARRVGAVGLVR